MKPVQTSLKEQKTMRWLEEVPGLKRLSEDLFKSMVQDHGHFRSIDGLFRVRDEGVLFVEYDGLRWHDDIESRKRDIRKTQLILNSDERHQVLRVRDTRLSTLDFEHPRFVQCSPVSKKSLLTHVMHFV